MKQCGGGDTGETDVHHICLYGFCTAQLGLVFPRERMAGIGKDGKLKMGGGDKGTLLGGRERRW